MDILEITQLLLRESSTAAVAVMALYMLKRSYEQRLEDLTEQREEARRHRDAYRATLSEIAVRLGENAEIHRQLLNYLQSHNGGKK